jgi:uncharacterized protein
MEKITRTLVDVAVKDLKEKMVFISGPRQVGKTTCARQVLAKLPGVYYTWDSVDDKKSILAGKWPEAGLVVLDEIHKYKQWKNFIKGHFDKRRDSLAFLVTGSARLNIYKKGGDSLQGRYHHHRLHPLSVGELEKSVRLPVPFRKLELGPAGSAGLIDHLLAFGGFPEPFFAASERTLRRWRKERYEQVIHEDVRDASNIHDLGLIEIFTSMLGPRTGSPLSLNSMREDLNVSHRTVMNWFSVLQHLYICYALPPFHGKMVNALKKEPKVYLWDWSEVRDPGARLENCVAGHLLKLCHGLCDREGFNARLWYLRDRQKREVDFLMTVDERPWYADEVNTSQPSQTNLE